MHLEKLDLSNISFDNVAWSLLSTDYDNVLKYYGVYLDEEARKKVDAYYCLGLVNYSNTNAHIDFNNCWEVKNFG